MHSCQKMADKCPAGRALGLNQAFPKQQQCSEKPYALMWAVGRNVMVKEPGGACKSPTACKDKKSKHHLEAQRSKTG